MRSAMLAGGTGLIGGQVLRLLLDSPTYDRVVAITRRRLPEHPKLAQLMIEFDQIEAHAETMKADDIFCCLGTTIAKAGSKERFYDVDFRFPLAVADATHRMGAKTYLLVSSLGANSKSPVFYNRVKGEIEEAICSVGFETVHIFRPSLLLGERSEKRSAEDAARFFYRIFGFAIPKKYKAIDSRKVAAAMLHFVSQNKRGNFIHESAELQDY